MSQRQMCGHGLCETCRYFDQGDDICYECPVQQGICCPEKPLCEICKWEPNGQPATIDEKIAELQKQVEALEKLTAQLAQRLENAEKRLENAEKRQGVGIL